MQRSLGAKLTAALVSGLVTAGLAWFGYRELRPEVETVAVVDNTDELFEMLGANEIERPALEHAAGPSAGAAPPDGAAAGTGEAPERPYPPPLVRTPLDEEEAGAFYPTLRSKGGLWLYDPQTYAVRAGGKRLKVRFAEHPDGGWVTETNSLGMLESAEVLEEPPDLRILVTGDSHTDGVCATQESFTNVLEGLLSAELSGQTVEALNAGAGGHNLYNYVGTFERLAELEPDFYVVVVYGGNDFSSAMVMQRYFERRPPFRAGPRRYDPQQALPAKERSLGSQELVQEVYFANNPDDVPLAIDLACSITVELERLCAEAGTRPFFVYLPPPLRGQPNFFRDELVEVLPYSGLEDVPLGVSDRIADRWLDFVDERGLPRLDLRPWFRASQPLLYWRTDHHINLEGHRLIAQLLEERLLELMQPESSR